MGKYIKAQTVIIIAVVCGIVAGVHWPALSAKALSFDDQQYLIKNVLVQNPGWASGKRFLTEVLEPSTVAGYYQPLAMISLMFDYAAGGRENNLRPFHVSSLALHTVNTALVIILLYMLFGNIWAAAAAGLLFGIHPMTVEPIPWVGERKTLLAAFFSLWSLILYVRYSRSGGWKAYAGCFVMYLLALMSKPTSVTAPIVMLLMDYWPLRRLKTKSIFEKLPLFILGVIFAGITYVSQQRTCVAISPTKAGPMNIFLQVCHNIIFYLYKIIVPINLSSHYAFPKPFGITQPMVLAGVVGTCALIVVLTLSLRWTRAAFTGWLIFFAAIFPAMGVVGFTNVIASDKFAYLPSIGLLTVVTSFLIWLGKNRNIRKTAVVIILILAVAEAMATQRYLVYWQDSITLANHMIALAPDSAPLYCDRGVAYVKRGEYELALADFNKAIEITPKYYEVYHNRGIIYNTKGEDDLALGEFDKALRINPKYAPVYDNRGRIYDSRGQFDKAIADYNTAISLKPEFVDAYNGRGNVYEKQGDFDRALADFNKAIAINPNYHDAWYNRGNIYKKKGEYAKAIADYDKAIALNPEFADAYNNRGNVYRRQGRYAPAISDFDKALEANPKYADAYFNKAGACEGAGQKKEAVAAYKAFIQYASINRTAQIELAKQKIKKLEQKTSGL